MTDEPKSKTQLKNEAESLQKIGVKLVELSQEKLDTLSLPDALKQAIMTAKTIKSHGALRRQAQLIGKLMRAANSDEIIAEYEQLLAEDKAKTAVFHQIELWRDRLIHGGREALTEFVECYHPEDVQGLRQLIKKATDELQKEKNTGASKALFRYLRSVMS
ncbi:ribosome biogenesis factor YjgA [Legionella yabuuchiae]|uniref:ribosome biogenesis factor YjgA n=1 Tax=Legionella yabuuchiae TaxID=376727 RepID=UPI0010546EE2|nr:ribosome biogenesis factor YjgA [Legionella yabuuchiae]